MEGKKAAGSSSSSSTSSSSSSSFTTELFGSKDSSRPSSVFGSIFAPPPGVIGREYVRSDVVGQTHDSANQVWNGKTGAPDDTYKSNEDGNHSVPNRDASSIYQEQRVQQPCHLSSSIYYGGQDIYHHPQNPEGSSVNSVLKKDGTEDDSDSASRGNWWKGSLYY